ncbi:unnamed protein product [Cyclocybe aegerita]|uniref:Uncharacterized protein n=1 Tax=Cyclocybe aegerita TaxID=1973307 RepID=A0A8S0VVV8_CYCAE|nr:unnamed protein product [Cyclocybe aegerita]
MYTLKTQRWFWLMLPLVRASLDSASSGDGFTDLSRTNADANSGIARRQTSTSTTFDFWWPFPAPVTSTTTTPATTPATPIPFLISPAASATQSVDVTPSSSIVVLVSAISSGPSSTSTRAPLSSSQASSSDDAVPTAQSADASPLGTFKATTLIPAFISVAIFLSALGIWVLYGCCTRKPRIRYDDNELVCGPPYANIENHDQIRDIEQHGAAGHEMFEVPQNHVHHGRLGQLQYRWPSFDEPPPFNPVKGHHNVPNESKRDLDEDPLSTITLLAAPHSNTRGRSQRSSKSALSAANANANPHPEMSPVFSDATSAALHELYESDDDEDAMARRAKETPWESLRHKSIRRGIIEQVKKENKWMDSIRGSLAAAAAQISGNAGGGSQNEREHDGQRESEGAGLQRKDESTMAARSPRSPEEDAASSVRRRMHRRADSNLQVDDVLPSPTYHRLPVNASESIDFFAGSPNGPPGVRRGYTWLRDREDEDRYTPRPTRTTDGRSRSRSRSRSTSPVKPRANRRHQDMSGRDILPQNPAQILSPPLESQICFTPMGMPVPPLVAQPAQSRPLHASSNTMTHSVRPKTRARGATIDTIVIPTRIPVPSPSKIRSTSRPRYRHQASSASSISGNSSSRPVPIPMSSEDSGEAVRGRSVKKAPASINTPSKKRSTANWSIDALKAEVDQDLRAQMRLQTKNAAEANAMKKVEQIMENSWSARDMREEEIRCLSPSGFGREP